MKFNVNRPHLGDKMYLPGDTREANEADVKHLINKGVLSASSSGKAEHAPANKAEKAAPKNKGE